MRRDAFIQNDSGGFSVLAADAVGDMIEAGRLTIDTPIAAMPSAREPTGLFAKRWHAGRTVRPEGWRELFSRERDR